MGNHDGLGRWLNAVVVWREIRCAAAVTSNLEDAARRDESRKSNHDIVYVCIVITYIIIRGRQTSVKIHVPRSTCAR